MQKNHKFSCSGIPTGWCLSYGKFACLIGIFASMLATIPFANSQSTFVPGTHEINGIHVTPNVVSPGQAFDLSDFPEPGRDVKVEWSEADQNFIIVEFE